MKKCFKYILPAAFIILFPALGMAQENTVALDVQEESVYFSKRPEIRLGWGGYPFILEKALLFRKGDVIGPDSNSLNDIYRNNSGAAYSTGAIMLSIDCPIKKWVSIPVVLSGNLCWQKKHDPALKASETEINGDLQLLSGARFRWINKPAVNLYGTVMAGIGVWNAEVIPAVQLVPIGVRFGKGHVFGFAELGVGTMYCGGMAGVGYKF